MNKKKISRETEDFIHARLILAQELLEESDRLEGIQAYKFCTEKLTHARHEREALVVYLLLTCFDRLGQTQGKHISFQNWLESKKESYTSQKSVALKQLASNSQPNVVASTLYKEYLTLYGVGKSFLHGIDNLNPYNRERLLNSIDVKFNPEFGSVGSNVSTPSYPLDNPKKESKLKLGYLFDLRNRFTHNLEQFNSLSTPACSEMFFKKGASWSVIIRGCKVIYLGVHQEHFKEKDGANVYTLSDWPFVLFETLYAAIDLPFDRTNINLAFQVHICHENGESETILNRIMHHQLRDIESLKKQ